MQDSQQRELMKQLDQLSEQIREREHEETRAKINELFQRVMMPGQKRMDKVDVRLLQTAPVRYHGTM